MAVYRKGRSLVACIGDQTCPSVAAVKDLWQTALTSCKNVDCPWLDGASPCESRCWVYKLTVNVTDSQSQLTSHLDEGIDPNPLSATGFHFALPSSNAFACSLILSLRSVLITVSFVGDNLS